MGLLSLAPDMQEAILMLPRVHETRDRVTERDLRTVAVFGLGWAAWVVQPRLNSSLDQN